MKGDEPNSGATKRRLALALLLALLLTLAAMVTVNAYVTKQVDSSLVEFDRGTFRGTGLLDIPPDVHSVQLLPIGLTGHWYEHTRHLPMALANLSAIANSPALQPASIYLVGGTDGTQGVRAEVYSAQTDLSGALTTWASEPALTEGRAGAGIALYPIDANSSMLYVVGGSRPNYDASRLVYRAVVDHATGHLGAWTTDSQQLPAARSYPGVVQFGGALYAVGGFGPLSNPDPSNQVYCSLINADGSLVGFSAISPLPMAWGSGVAVAYDGDTDTLYFIGGRDNNFPTFTVYFADINAPCNLGAWTLSDGNLPVNLYGHAGMEIEGEILLTGGIADDIDPSQGISSTVKAALVDPTNEEFRLFDWCLGVQPPTCTIGAWQTGELMPEVRALHATVESHGNVFVLGGEDANVDPTDTIFFGTFHGIGGLYSPEGTFTSEEMVTGQPATLRRVRWEATIGYPGEMTIAMSYRTRQQGGMWSNWSTPQPSVNGTNQYDPPSPQPTNISSVQYKFDFTTQVSIASPLLDWVEVYYEVPDPELAVVKVPQDPEGVSPGDDFEYTIYYTNFGGWVAESVVLTETLPPYTSYVGGSDWQRVGSSNQYELEVGDVERDQSGTATFRIHVPDNLPPTVSRLTNTVEINYPTMWDELNLPVDDPLPDNNIYEVGSDVLWYNLDIKIEPEPPTDTPVYAGDRITYTIYYTNAGLIDATQAVVTELYDPDDDYFIVSTDPAPTTGDNVWDLGLLAAGARGQIVVVVQLNTPQPSYWPITNQARIASPEGDPVNASVVTHFTGEVPGVDLVVRDISWLPANPTAGQPLTIMAVTANEGETSLDGELWMEVYIKPRPSSPPDGPSDHDLGYCVGDCNAPRIDFVQRLSGQVAPGGEFNVTFSEANAPLDLMLPTADCYDIYIQADVAFDAQGFNYYWGRWPEESETNNVRHEVIGTCSSGGSPIAYLPIIFKRH